MLTISRALVLVSMLVLTACSPLMIKGSNNIGDDMPKTFKVGEIKFYHSGFSSDFETPATEDPDFAAVLKNSISYQLDRYGLLAQPGVPSGNLEIDVCYFAGGGLLFGTGKGCLENTPTYGAMPSILIAKAVVFSPEGKVLATSAEFHDFTPFQSGMGLKLAQDYAQWIVSNFLDVKQSAQK
jgi:hypothetical protein